MNMKIALVGALLATALVTTFASAQDQQPAPAAAIAHQMPAGPGVDMAALCAHVDLSGRSHFYPDHARDHHIEGQTMLECALDATNHIETCWLLSETPPNDNFGQAAMNLSCHVRQAPVH